jgi:DNA-binding cell septation regulator SpoVG
MQLHVLAPRNSRRYVGDVLYGSFGQRHHHMKVTDITVEMRLSQKQDSKVKAFADVTIPLGDDGTVTVLGFSVLDGDGRRPRVMAPARKGKQAWLETVQLTGKVRHLTDEAVLAEYERKSTKFPG